jgi:hypothetical protein
LACEQQPNGRAKEADRHQHLDPEARHERGPDCHPGTDPEPERQVAEATVEWRVVEYLLLKQGQQEEVGKER